MEVTDNSNNALANYVISPFTVDYQPVMFYYTGLRQFFVSANDDEEKKLTQKTFLRR